MPSSVAGVVGVERDDLAAVLAVEPDVALVSSTTPYGSLATT